MNLKQRTKIVQELYKRDSAAWIVAFSGGKDSMAVLSLLWYSVSRLEECDRQKPIVVAYVDTGMEHPAYAREVLKTLRAISLASKKHRMPFETAILEPELKHRYFVSVIGRGYAPPTHWFRWCTTGMRIKPMSRFIKSLSDSSGAVIAMGLRRSESQSRAEIIDKYSSGTAFVGQYGALKNVTAFTPIEDFSAAEVWQFLLQTPCAWADRNTVLARVYSAADAQDCPSEPTAKKKGSCGGSRFGCWTCTVVRKDKSGANLADQSTAYAELHELRNWLAEVRYDKSRRWLRRRNGAPGPGPLNLSLRREILEKVLTIQFKRGLSLMREDELSLIEKMWTQDGARNPTVKNIYQTISRRYPFPIL